MSQRSALTGWIDAKNNPNGKPVGKTGGLFAFAGSRGHALAALRNNTLGLRMVNYYRHDIDRFFGIHVIVHCTICMAGMQKYDYSIAL